MAPVAPTDDEIEVAIAGDGVTPETVPLRETIAVLSAMAGLLEAVAAEDDVPTPPVSLVEIRDASAGSALRATDATPITRRTLRRVTDACRARGNGFGKDVRRALRRLHDAGKTGHIRIATGIGADRVEIALATPLERQEGSGIEMATTVYGRVVKIEDVKGASRVAIRYDNGGSGTFDADDDVALVAGSLFKQAVKARVTYLRGTVEEDGTLEQIEAFVEGDFLATMRALRAKFTAEGLSLGGSELLATLRDLRTDD